MSAVVPFEPRVAVTEADRLGAEITELFGYICAATCHLLELIHDFDEHKYWAEQGFYSCAHWLNFHCGIGKNAAREKVRIADASNEDYLLNLCKHGTAHHVERVVSKYRRAKNFADRNFVMRQIDKREVSWRYDDDGCIVIKAKLPPDQGDMVLKALEKAIDVSGVDPHDPVSDTAAQRRADALGKVAETYLSNSNCNGRTADRYQVVVHVGAASAANIENGPDVTAVTSERIACDCSKVHIEECKHGEPLSIGRKSRVIPSSIWRRLKARDGGCRFPGCTHERFVDGHHIKHWSKGGETSLDNLVLLCRYHHVLVHEGGFDCRKTKDGEIYFVDQRGKRLAETPTYRGVTLEESMAYMYRRYPETLGDGCRAQWYAGDEIDYDHTVALLFPELK